MLAAVHSMSRIHIERDHALGLQQARQLASRWVDTAQVHLGMHCMREQGDVADQITFRRAGVHGCLTVRADRFVVEAKLGLLLGAFRQRIESEVVHNLDRLLAHDEPIAAFDEAVARRHARASASTAGEGSRS
jgi:putative polyhydroxyalkanoate system protein